jgi:hypothetical protein
VSIVSKWNVQALVGGGHRVVHCDHETDEVTLAGTFGPEVALGDLLAMITTHAADGDYVLLPDGSPVLILDFHKHEPTS